MTLVITGGLRKPADFAKALALGADAIAVSNAAIQAIGCLGMRACHTNNCPVGIATQKPELRARLPVQIAAKRLQRFFESAVELMQVLARACGHTHLNQFRLHDLTTWKRDVVEFHQAIDAADAERTRKLAHRMKSASANLGAARLAALCQNAESLARDERLDDITQDADQDHRVDDRRRDPDRGVIVESPNLDVHRRGVDRSE